MSRLYPWYDSVWLERYSQAKGIVGAVRPQALAAFIEAFRPLHTREDFSPVVLDRPLGDGALDEIRQVVAALEPTELELHEARRFQRFVVHDHPAFTRLQERVALLVGDVVGEPVEASYNFLSLYASGGVCPLHLDAPSAKWTFDLCIDQSVPWPIHFSRVQRWEEIESYARAGPGWEERVRDTPSLAFTPCVLQAGQAVVFSGSSQWHYRDPMPPAPGVRGCTLLFLHFIPRGTAQLVPPENWASWFGIPELAAVGPECDT